MNTLLQDIRYAIRLLGKKPGFTAVAVISLALGIGANTAIFSLVNTTMLKALPVEKPEQLVSVFTSKSGSGISIFSYLNYKDFRERNEAFTDMVLYRFAPVSLSRGGDNQRLWCYLVSGNYFDTLGVKPILGRGFLPEEYQTEGSHPVTILSYDCWQQYFGANQNILGTTILLNSLNYTVIGVAPRGFKGTELVFAPDFYVPVMMLKQIEPGANYLQRRGTENFFALGRLKPGVNMEQAQASLNTLAYQLAQEYPDTNEGQEISLSPPGLLIPDLRDSVFGFASVLMVVVALVLLVACTNLASLLLARATERQKEIAIRLAVGASRGRLVRQLITESVILSVLGGTIGVLLAMWVVDIVSSLKLPIDFPLLIDIEVDRSVLIFSILLSFVTGVIFGLIPAFQATRPDLVGTLKDETGVGGYRRSRLRNGLVIAQLSLSLLLLIAAGLVVRSLYTQAINPGFNSENVVTMSFDVSLQGYESARGKEFVKQLMERSAALPGISDVSMVGYLPLSLNRSYDAVYIEGAPPARGANVPNVMTTVVWPDYFKTMGIPFVRGRDFNQQDKEGAKPVVIVNEAFARKFWPGPDSINQAIGKRLSSRGPEGPFMEIVGITSDGKYISLQEDPQPFFYTDMIQDYSSYVAIVARGQSSPQTTIAAIRQEILKLDPNLPLFDVKTMNQHLGLSLFPARVAGILLGSFGLLVLVLAAVGVYGVMSYSVSRRTREIGLRMALGAGPREVLGMIIKQGMMMALIGVGIGLVAALLLTRLMSGLLAGVSPTDPVTFISIPLLLGLIAFLACYIPARRAMKVDPMLALRYE
jgi:predicted permease